MSPHTHGQPTSARQGNTHMDINPETHYFTVAEVQAMDQDQLTALFEYIPGPWQAAFKTAFDEFLGDQNDYPSRLQALELLLYKYQTARSVPGSNSRQWLQAGDLAVKALTAESEELQAAYQADTKPGPSRRILIAGGVLILALVCSLSLILGSLNKGRQLSTEQRALATQTASALAALPQTPTPTATPLALEDTDAIIDAGDYSDYYPTTLEIFTDDEHSRVFVVQQVAVEISDWTYDARNPDTASWIGGLIIRPPIGIPYSPENAALLESLQPGNRIILRMSTGNFLSFDITASRRVQRQETSIFRQITPGITLVLLGQPDTDTRLVVEGHYPPDQELSRLADILTAADARAYQLDSPADFPTFTLVTSDAYTSTGPAHAPLPADMMFLLVDVSIETDESHALSLTRVRAQLQDAGTIYHPTSADPSLTRHVPVNGQNLTPDSRYQLTYAFLVPRTLSSAPTFSFRTEDGSSASYHLIYRSPDTASVSQVDVQILDINTRRETAWPYNPEALAVTARLFNPFDQALLLRSNDIYAIFSPTLPEGADRPGDDLPFPIGPPQDPDNVTFPLSISPGEALDLIIEFRWSGQPYAGIDILGYRYVALLQ